MEALFSRTPDRGRNTPLRVLYRFLSPYLSSPLYECASFISSGFSEERRERRHLVCWVLMAAHSFTYIMLQLTWQDKSFALFVPGLRRVSVPLHPTRIYVYTARVCMYICTSASFHFSLLEFADRPPPLRISCPLAAVPTPRLLYCLGKNLAR